MFKGGVFAPDVKLAEVPAVISPKNDNCGFAEIEPVEFIENFSDLSIHIADCCAVAVSQFALLGFVLQPARGNIVLP